MVSKERRLEQLKALQRDFRLWSRLPPRDRVLPPPEDAATRAQRLLQRLPPRLPLGAAGGVWEPEEEGAEREPEREPEPELPGQPAWSNAKRLRGQLGIAVRNGDFAAGLEGWLVQGGCEVVPWLGRQAVLMKRRGSMVQLIGQPPRLTGERSLLLSFEVTCCCTEEGGNGTFRASVGYVADGLYHALVHQDGRAVSLGKAYFSDVSKAYMHKIVLELHGGGAASPLTQLVRDRRLLAFRLERVYADDNADLALLHVACRPAVTFKPSEGLDSLGQSRVDVLEVGVSLVESMREENAELRHRQSTLSGLLTQAQDQSVQLSSKVLLLNSEEVLRFGDGGGRRAEGEEAGEEAAEDASAASRYRFLEASVRELEHNVLHLESSLPLALLRAKVAGLRAQGQQAARAMADERRAQEALESMRTSSAQIRELRNRIDRNLQLSFSSLLETAATSSQGAEFGRLALDLGRSLGSMRVLLEETAAFGNLVVTESPVYRETKRAIERQTRRVAEFARHVAETRGTALPRWGDAIISASECNEAVVELQGSIGRIQQLMEIKYAIARKEFRSPGARKKKGETADGSAPPRAPDQMLMMMVLAEQGIFDQEQVVRDMLRQAATLQMQLGACGQDQVDQVPGAVFRQLVKMERRLLHVLETGESLLSTPILG